MEFVFVVPRTALFPECYPHGLVPFRDVPQPGGFSARAFEDVVAREGFFVDTPTGQRIDEDGRLVDEGFFVDTPTGIRIREDGRVVEEGFFVDTSTKGRIDEDGRLVDEGFVVDIPTGTKFVKE